LPDESHTELIVALDYPEPQSALRLVESLRGLPVIYKVGLELFLSGSGSAAGGSEFVRELVERHKARVFLDLKLHDIPNTVSRAAKQAALMGVEMFTLHLAGGGAMVRAVVQEFKELSSKSEAALPKILGVTVLTSFDEAQWTEVMGAMTGHSAASMVGAADRSIATSVEGLVQKACEWGANGVVCSAFELPLVRAKQASLYTVVPGIRPMGSSVGDQARVMTPAQASCAGANAIVMGRPITASPNPRLMVESVLKELSNPKHSS